jgi:hypothetical protein
LSHEENALIKKTGYPVVTGCFTLSSACLLIVLNSVALAETLRNAGTFTSFDTLFEAQLAIHVINYSVSAVGIAGSIMALKRRNVILATIGTCLLISTPIYDIPNFIVGFQASQGGYYSVFPLIPTFVTDITIAILSILALILLFKTKAEFS